MVSTQTSIIRFCSLSVPWNSQPLRDRVRDQPGSELQPDPGADPQRRRRGLQTQRLELPRLERGLDEKGRSPGHCFRRLASPGRNLYTRLGNFFTNSGPCLLSISIHTQGNVSIQDCSIDV